MDNIHASMKGKTADVVEFSDVSDALKEAGIPDIDLFPGVRKWKAAQQADKVIAVIPAELRALVARKLIVSILGGLFRGK